MHFHFYFDELLFRYDLGYLYPGNEFHKEHEHQALSVPECLEPRFVKFWENAKQQLGEKLKVYHVQVGIPLGGKRVLNETVYCISWESAEQLMQHFYEILPAGL